MPVIVNKTRDIRKTIILPPNQKCFVFLYYESLIFMLIMFP